MRKILSGFLRVLLTPMFYGFPMWLSTVVAIFAFNQNFGVGLVIMLGLVIVQLLLSIAVSDLKWDEFSDFDFRNMSSDSRVSKRFNIVFNLTRVGTIISSLAFLFQSGLEINPFGGLGITISIVVTVIALLSFLSFIDFYDSGYKYVRGVLSVLALIPLLVFSYLYFGTQLIWIPALLSLAFSYSKGFWELDDEEYGLFASATPILLGLSSLISTIIQFYQEITSWFMKSLDVVSGIILSFLTLEIFFIPLWLYILVFVIIFTIIKTAKWSAKKSIQKRKDLTELAEKEKEKEESLIRSNKREEERVAKIKELMSLKDDDFIYEDDILFVTNHLGNSNYFSEKSAARILGHGDLFRAFVEVSDIKKQIFYKPVINGVLDNYNKLFKQMTNDEILLGLIAVIRELTEAVNKVADYKGAPDLKQQIFNVFRDIPQFQQKQEK